MIWRQQCRHTCASHRVLVEVHLRRLRSTGPSDHLDRSRLHLRLHLLLLALSEDGLVVGGSIECCGRSWYSGLRLVGLALVVRRKTVLNGWAMFRHIHLR